MTAHNCVIPSSKKSMFRLTIDGREKTGKNSDTGIYSLYSEDEKFSDYKKLIIRRI